MRPCLKVFFRRLKQCWQCWTRETMRTVWMLCCGLVGFVAVKVRSVKGCYFVVSELLLRCCCYCCYCCQVLVWMLIDCQVWLCCRPRVSTNRLDHPLIFVGWFVSILIKKQMNYITIYTKFLKTILNESQTIWFWNKLF